jgi:hypothetical protein
MSPRYSTWYSTLPLTLFTSPLSRILGNFNLSLFQSLDVQRTLPRGIILATASLIPRCSPTLQVWARHPSWSRLPSFRHFPLLRRYRSQRGRQRSARARVRIRLWSRSPWRHRRYRYRYHWPRSCCHQQRSATTLVSFRVSRS